MTWEIATAFVFIGTVYLMFKFSEMIDSEKEWSQPLKLMINMVGLFMIIASLGWTIRLQETTSGVDPSLPNITVIVFFALLFVVLPLVLIFIVIFVKQLLEFYDNLRKGKNFNKDEK